MTAKALYDTYLGGESCGFAHVTNPVNGQCNRTVLSTKTKLGKQPTDCAMNPYLPLLVGVLVLSAFPIYLPTRWLSYGAGAFIVAFICFFTLAASSLDKTPAGHGGDGPASLGIALLGMACIGILGASFVVRFVALMLGRLYKMALTPRSKAHGK